MVIAKSNVQARVRGEKEVEVPFISQFGAEVR